MLNLIELSSEQRKISAETIAKMHFPNEKDRKKKNVFVNYLEKNKSKKENYTKEKKIKILNQARQNSKKGFIVGLLFEFQLFFYLQNEPVPSIRMLESYFKDNNIYINGKHCSLSSARKYITFFNPVLHLWATEFYFKTNTEEYLPCMPTHGPYYQPNIFFNMADYFKKTAVNSGLFEYDFFWMPSNWENFFPKIKTKKPDTPLSIEFVQHFKEYSKTYQEERKWDTNKKLSDS